MSFEIVRGGYTLLSRIDLVAIDALFNDMITEVESVVERGALGAALDTRRSAFMRYKGQGHEIEITLPNRALTESDLDDLTGAFEQAYASQFSRPVPGMQIEVLNWAVRLSTQSKAIAPIRDAAQAKAVAVSDTKPLRCDVTGRTIDAALIHRATLRAGDTLCRPAMVLEPQTTTFVGADFDLKVDGALNLVFTRRPQP